MAAKVHENPQETIESAKIVAKNAEKLHEKQGKRIETRGERMCRFIETFCRVPEGMFVGQPLRLDPFQRKFILDVYDNPVPTELGILSTGRKNAKTGTIACLVLGHLVGPEAKQNSEIVSGALSREQAAKVYNYASKMVKLNPALSLMVKPIPSKKILIGLPMNVTYQAISAEAATAMGGSPIVAILDETGQIKGPHDAFVDAIMTSQGAHEIPLLLIISTQAENDTDLLSTMIDDARKSKDPHIVCHVYEAKKGCDVMDEEQWRASNPALGNFRSESDMRKMAKRAQRMPSFENAFRNLYLNQRVSSLSPFITIGIWEGCGDDPVPIEECDVLYGALDLSGRIDLTCFLLIGWARGKWNVYAWFWTPEQGLAERQKVDKQPYLTWVQQGHMRVTPGPKVGYDYVASEVGAIIDGLNVPVIAYDRWKIDDFKRECEKIGLELPLVEWGQGFKDMEYAIDIAEEIFLGGNFRHGMNPVLTMCAANAKVTKDPAGNRKLDKAKSTGRIDGLQALVMAAGAAKRTAADDEQEFDTFVKDPLILR